MTCPACQHPLATISVELGGQELTMGSCNRCRVRHWFRDGERFDFRGEIAPAARAS